MTRTMSQTMRFTIRYLRDGSLVGMHDHAETMFDARKVAHKACESRNLSLAIISAPTSSGAEKEIETIRPK